MTIRGKSEIQESSERSGHPLWLGTYQHAAATPQPDFLRQDARTELRETFHVAGVGVSLTTNSDSILRFAREAFGEPTTPADEVRASLRLWADSTAASMPPWPKPRFRGISQFVFGGLDCQNSFLIDLRTRTVLGRFSPAMAADRTMWKTVVFPVMVSALAPSLGLTILHCACVAQAGRAILLAGPSGAGKSTLALALAQTGFRFISDDRTLVSQIDSRLSAWGVLPCAKLRPQARQYFGDLREIAPANLWAGEEAYCVEPAGPTHSAADQRSEPTLVLFLERQPAPEFTLVPISSREACERLEEGLSKETPDVQDRQRRFIAALAERECWVLRHGGNPHKVAQELRDFFHGRDGNPSQQVPMRTQSAPRVEVHRRDPLRRFTATPLAAQLEVMDRTLRVETNNPAVLDSLRRLFHSFGPEPPLAPQFRWRIVTEADGGIRPPWPEMTAFSGPGRRFINFGRHSFIAADLEAREAAGILASGLAEDESGLASLYLAALFYLSGSALGLFPVTAACVAQGERGILVFGEPGSGKTTSSYVAQRAGLEFHADQSTFLELEGNQVLAWGDFWPAAFREEAAAFFPELRTRARILSQGATRFLSIPKPSKPGQRRPVRPVASVFLEKGDGDSPRLRRLPPPELADRMKGFIPFKEEARFEAERNRALRVLAESPAFRLTCSDPWAAARFYRSIFDIQHLLERGV